MKSGNIGQARRQVLAVSIITSMLFGSPAFLPVERALKFQCRERWVLRLVHQEHSLCVWHCCLWAPGPGSSSGMPLNDG